MLEAWDRRTDAAPSPDALHALGPPVSPAAGSLAAATAVSAARPVRVAPAVAVDTSDDSLQLDIAGKVSSSFGWRNDPLHGRTKFHGGIDLAAAYGTAVPVAAGGTVVRAGEQGAYGLSVVVRHAGGYESRYAHLSSVDVAVGDTIEKGAVLGRVGSTGRSTAPHLHFEVTRAGQRVDPERFVRNLTSDTKGQ